MMFRNAYLIFILVSILLVLITIGIYFYNFSSYVISLNPADWAYFGDYFSGILSPIFSLLAFLGLLYSLHLQSKFQNISNFENSYIVTLQQLDESLEALFATAPSIVFINDYPTYKHIFILFNSYKNKSFLKYPDQLSTVLNSFLEKERKEYAHYSEMKWIYNNLDKLLKSVPTSMINTPLIDFYQDKIDRLKPFFNIEDTLKK